MRVLKRRPGRGGRAGYPRSELVDPDEGTETLDFIGPSSIRTCSELVDPDEGTET